MINMGVGYQLGALASECQNLTWYGGGNWRDQVLRHTIDLEAFDVTIICQQHNHH